MSLLPKLGNLPAMEEHPKIAWAADLLGWECAPHARYSLELKFSHIHLPEVRTKLL